MLAKITGTIWILLGLLWLIKPEALKRRLKKKMSRAIRWTIYGFIFMLGFLLIGSIIKLNGMLPRMIGLIAIIVIVRFLMILTSKTSEKVLSKLAERPVIFFRLWALFILATGVALVTM